MKSLELSIKDFYCIFVRTEKNLIAFLGPSNCINTQCSALSGAMDNLCKQFGPRSRPDLDPNSLTL